MTEQAKLVEVEKTNLRKPDQPLWQYCWECQDYKEITGIHDEPFWIQFKCGHRGE